MSDIVMDLPTPPSVNRIWRANKAGPKKVSVSKEYASWQKSADALSMQLGQFRGLKTVTGKFEARVIIKRCAGDIDNRHKGVLDWLQSRGVIENDKYCEKLTLEWGDAPAGCRVTITPLSPQTVNDVLRAAAERLEAQQA